MIKVSCHKCGQKRKAVDNRVYYVWLEHSFGTHIMRKDSNGRWECCNGYGCDKKEK